MNIHRESVVDGNQTLVLGLIWAIIHHYQVNRFKFISTGKQHLYTSSTNVKLISSFHPGSPFPRGRGGTCRIHDRGGGSDRASYCKPKKIHEPEILHQKIPGIKISYPQKYKR